MGQGTSLKNLQDNLCRQREIKEKMCRGCVDELGMLLYLGITASCKKKKILVKISSYFMMKEKRGRINLKYGRRDWYM